MFKNFKFLISRSGFSKQGGFEIHIENTEEGIILYDHFFEIGNEFNLRPGIQTILKELRVVYCHMAMIWILEIIHLNVV